MVYSRSVIVFALCFLLCADLAFSKVDKCYKCFSPLKGDCALNPKQRRFVENCTGDPVEGYLGNFKISNRGENKTSVEYACIKAVITKSSVGNTTMELVVRGCGTKKTCESNHPHPALNITSVESCVVCNGDLCNSSSIISAGYYSVIISSMLLFVFWK